MSPKQWYSKTELGILISGFLTLVFLISLSSSFGYYVLHFNLYFIIMLILVPILNIIFCVPYHMAGFHITSIKYWRLFPLIFYFDPQPKYNRFKKIKELKASLEPGDILLTRIDNYLHGVVLKQTSYFTHMGIYYGTKGDQENQVIHEISETGVDFISIDDFAKCDDVLVLRLEEPYKDLPNKEFQKMNELILAEERTGVFSNVCQKTENVKKIIQSECVKENASWLYLQEQELEIYSKLESKQNVPKPEYIPVVLGVAESRRKIGYDFSFDFKLFQRFSCVSFVWYAYKCLYPFHEVRINRFYYFNFIRTCVIVPDSFIKSEKLTVIFGSIERGITKKEEISAFITKNKFNYWLFLGKILVVQILILLLFKLIWSLLGAAFPELAPPSSF